jgi:hypothetical protein
MELELTRTPSDRRLYALEGVGRLRLLGFGSRAALAEADGGTWRLGRRRFWQRDIQATDATGVVVGEFEPRTVPRGATFVVPGLAEDAGAAAGASAAATG